MKLHCPHCGVKGSADDSYSGRKVKCPKCQGMFEVKPDMALELPEDATLLSAALSTPTESSTPFGEAEIAITEESDLEETEEDGALSVGEAEDSVEIDVDLADTEPEILPPGEEEELNWEDVASEIDLQLAEGDSEEEFEEELEGDPADISSLQDEFEKPAADFGLTVEEEDGEIGDESSEELEAEAEGQPAEIEVTELMEESPLLDPAIPEQEIASDQAESAEIAESDEEGLLGEEVELAPEDDGIELEPYGIDKEQCWQCGKENIVGEQPFIAKDDRLYCTDCIPFEDTAEALDTHQELNTDDNLDEAQSLDDDALTESAVNGPSNQFSIGDAIRQAWAKTKGAKGSIWAGSAIMYLVILAIVVGGALLLPSLNGDMTNIPGLVINILLQALTNVFYVIFTAGLLLMGIRKVAGDRISWKMIFQGFPCAGKIIVATILQSIFVAIGFLLLVLPGIYLAIGYAMTIPLIIDKGLAPWQAMEMSRKAIHKIWWKVTGLFIVMCLIFVVSVIPLGIGLIWTWPMFFILGGVVYRYLFSGEKEVS